MALTRRFTALNAVAVLLGVLAGLAAVGFRRLIELISSIAFTGKIGLISEESGQFVEPVWGIYVFLVPTVGGLLIGLIRTVFPSVKRQGISEVMASIQVRGGNILARSAWGHAVISALTVGTGGSTGREGPIGYIGGAIGSSLGRHLGFRRRDIKVLVGAGVAAGIAATFNAPLGGVLFALELILPEFSTHAFIPLVIATVIAVTVSYVFLGDAPAFLIDPFQFVHPIELVFYLALGLLCGVGGVGFIKVLGRATEIGDELKMPVWLKPTLGGLAVGILGVGISLLTFHPAFGGRGAHHIFGTGYATVNAILQGDATVIVIPLILLLIVLKPLASSFTIASGGGGGVFSASLYQGALYGALVGIVANLVLPDMTASVSAYALVGMGAFYASSGRATLTTIILLTELTDGYTIVLPLMFSAIIADGVSHALSEESIYTVRLRKRGIRFDHDRILSPLDTMTVGQVMTRDVKTIANVGTVGQAYMDMLESRYSAYPVMDKDRLAGLASRKDVSRWMADGRGEEPIGNLAAEHKLTVTSDQLLHVACKKMNEAGVGRLLVVDHQDPDRLVGILTNTDVLRAEATEVEHDDMFTGQGIRLAPMWNRGRGKP